MKSLFDKIREIAKQCNDEVEADCEPDSDIGVECSLSASAYWEEEPSDAPYEYIFPSGSSYISRYEHIPVKKSNVEIMICPYCKAKNRIYYDKLPAIGVLVCGACGGNLE